MANTIKSNAAATYFQIVRGPLYWFIFRIEASTSSAGDVTHVASHVMCCESSMCNAGIYIGVDAIMSRAHCDRVRRGVSVICECCFYKRPLNGFVV